MAALSLPWAPSGVGAGYGTRAGFGNGTDGLGGDSTVVERTVGDASTVLHFENIAQTYLMAASWESQRLAGTCLSAIDKKFMTCVILYSGVTIG